MSVLGRLVSRPKAAMTSADLQRELQGGLATQSGAIINSDVALTLSAVWGCVRVLSRAVAQIPLFVWQKTDAGRKRAPDHPVANLLEDEPNPWQTDFEWREMMMAHAVLAGNAYSIKTVVRGEIRELLPVPPSRVTVRQGADYQKTYEVAMPNGTPLLVPDDRMLHLPGMTWNGISGLSVVGHMREVLGVGLQQQVYGAKLYANGAQIRGVIEHPKVLSKEGIARWRDQFDEVYSGATNAHKIMILEEGAKFSATGMTADDAQFLESRKFTRSEIASWFGVPLHMINDLDRATFANIEHQSLEFVTFSLMPWLVRWEKRLGRCLLSKEERRQFYAKFLVQGLLRGDFKSRVDGYSQAILNGWMNRNEVRELEEMNRADGLDQFLTPLNMGSGAQPPPGAPNAKP